MAGARRCEGQVGMHASAVLLLWSASTARATPPLPQLLLDRYWSEKFKILAIGRKFHPKLLLWLLIGGETEDCP